MTTFTESVIEEAAFVWLEGRGCGLPKLISGAVRVGDVERFVGTEQG